MLAGVAREVEVELGNRLLQDPPHRLAVVGHEAHQPESRVLGGGDSTEVRHQQRRLVVLRQLMVDGEIAKVEEAIAHSRILPIHDPNGDAVIDEVGVEQVVVAEHGRLGERARSMVTATACARSCAAGRRPPWRIAVSAYASTTRKGEKALAMDPAWWIRRSDCAMRSSMTGSWTVWSRTGCPSMKRATSTPSGSPQAVTSGPTPAAAARRLASRSIRRSIPSRLPLSAGTRTTKTSWSTATR